MNGSAAKKVRRWRSGPGFDALAGLAPHYLGALAQRVEKRPYRENRDSSRYCRADRRFRAVSVLGGPYALQRTNSVWCSQQTHWLWHTKPPD